MKIILDAKALGELVKLDPEGSVELARTAASQVATEIANRVAKQAIEQRVNAHLNGLIVTGHYRAQLNDTGRKLVVEEIRAQQAKLVTDDEKLNRRIEVRTMIREELDREIERAVLLLGEKIDSLIMARFSAIFSKQP